jgi:CHAT domain-containing protein
MEELTPVTVQGSAGPILDICASKYVQQAPVRFPSLDACYHCCQLTSFPYVVLPANPGDSTAEMRVPPRVAGPLTVVAALLLTSGQACSRRVGHLSARRIALLDSLGPARPVEGRILGIEFSPYPASRPPTPRHKKQFRIAQSEIEREAEIHPQSQAWADRGILLLVTGELEGAREQLEAAERRAPQDAGILSDLSAVYLELGASEPSCLVRALEAAIRSVEADPSLEEARFNLALALERNFLYEDAAAAWQDYLRVDSGSRWAAEGPSHMAAVRQSSRAELWKRVQPALRLAALAGDEQRTRRIAGQFTQYVRRYEEDSVLPAWAEALHAGDAAKAQESLQIARVVGTVLERNHGEHMAVDSIAVIDRLAGKPDEAGLKSLAGAYKDLVSGSGLCRAGKEEGEGSMLRAWQVFSYLASPAKWWAKYYLGVCAWAGNEPRAAISELEALERRPELVRYPVLSGRVHWMLGLSYGMVAEPVLALEHYELAERTFRRVGAEEELAPLRGRIAEYLFVLGESRRAWTYLLGGVSACIRSGETWHLSPAFDKLADSASDIQQYRAALRYRREVVRLAKAELDRNLIAHGLMRLAETSSALGDEREAMHRLDEAGSWIERAGAKDSRLQAEWLAARGRVHLAWSEFRAALPYLKQALSIYQEGEDRTPALGVYGPLAQAYEGVGDEASAENELLTGLAEFTKVREAVTEEANLQFAFDRASSLLDQLVDLKARQGAAEEALRYAEQGRARILQERLRPGSASNRVLTATPSSIRAHLAAGHALIEYAVLPDRLLLWIIRPDAIYLARQEIRAERLAQVVERFRRQLETGMDARTLQHSSELLSREILGPALPYLRPGDAITFVPDKSLHGVPFGALRDTKNGHYLLQDHQIGVAPSATTYLECRSRARQHQRAGNLPRILVLGDPAIGESLKRRLTSLVNARREAEEVSALYGGSAKLLLGDAATREALFSMGQYDRAHIASHAIVNSALPHLSCLVLSSGSNKARGEVYAYEIARQNFPRITLVVLSGCSTGSGLTQVGEGTLSIARSFLLAGVPNVVASLWDIDDEASRRLAVGFHRMLRAGEDFGAALRKAQLELLSAEDESLHSPAAWAAFEVIGG